MKVSGLALLAAIALGGTAPALAQDAVTASGVGSPVRTVTTTTSRDGPDVSRHRDHGHRKVCRIQWRHHHKVKHCTWRRW